MIFSPSTKSKSLFIMIIYQFFNFTNSSKNTKVILILKFRWKTYIYYLNEFLDVNIDNIPVDENNYINYPQNILCRKGTAVGYLGLN